LHLAEQYLVQAREMCSMDPLTYNELGVISYLNKNYQAAIEFFQKALDLCGTNIPETFEPTLFNMAHCHRKLRNYEAAIRYYTKALSLNPDNASTYTALGFSQQLQGNIEAAVECYHQSLSFHDDSFTSTMLTKALEEL